MNNMITFPEITDNDELISNEAIKKENHVLANYLDGKSKNIFEERYAENTIKKVMDWLIEK